MVTSILPHKEEAALADSNPPSIGSFKPTGFSRWWFSSFKGVEYTREKIMQLLNSKRDSLERLYQEADWLRQECVGDEVYLRGIIEFSNIC